MESRIDEDAAQNLQNPTDDGMADETPVDRFSSLPESIICHILSILPLESAVATSILSKSWRYHWTNRTEFHFDDGLWVDDNTGSYSTRHGFDFVDIVGSCLDTQNVDVSMNKLLLRIKNRRFPFVHLNTWINSAVARNLRVLDIELCRSNRRRKFTLPGALYTCGTLETLRLTGLATLVKAVSHEICLPKLTDLELNNVKYESDESLPMLTSGCPRLRSLRISRLCNDNMVVCTISSPVLKRFYMFFHAPRSDLHFKLVIDTPALESLSLTDYSSKEIISSQELMCLDWVIFHVRSIPHQDFIRLIQAFDRVECMVIYLTTLNLGGNYSKLLANFRKLFFLRITVEDCDALSCAMDLVGSCTALERLIISNYKGGQTRIRSRSCQTDPTSVPECFLSTLTSFHYWGFEGLEDEMAMLMLVLNQALVMKSFEVQVCHHDRDPYSEEELSLLKKIFMSSAVSPGCEVSIC